ncbi:MAG: SdpI family protein [Cyanobacteria bacterium J06648_11]
MDHNTSYVLWFLTGVLLSGTAIPLIREAIPPNRWYGFRVAKTLSDEAIWYEANRVAGYDLLLAGIAVAIAAVVNVSSG